MRRPVSDRCRAVNVNGSVHFDLRRLQVTAGYAYGSAEISRSPVSLDELDDLKRAVGFDADDERALEELGDILRDRREQLFERWFGLVGHFFLPTFAGPDGTPDQTYIDRTHPRFMQWSRTRAHSRTTRTGSTTSTRSGFVTTARRRTGRTASRRRRSSRSATCRSPCTR